MRTFLHPASLLILNFYPRTRQETCGGLVYAGRKRTRSLSTSLFCPPNGLAFSQPIYLPTLPTYSRSLSLSTEPCNQPFSEPITVHRSPVHGRSNTQRLGPDRTRTRRVARIPVEKCAQRTNADEMIATGWYRVAFLLLFVRERRRRRWRRKVGGWRKRLKGGWRCGWKTRGLLDGRGDQ